MGNPLQTSKKLTSLNDIFGGGEEVKAGVVTELNVEKLIPFKNHPFKLYTGARLDDMVRSIKDLGVLMPLLVRAHGLSEYEVLSGHNRLNAAKIVGLEKVPVRIIECTDNSMAMLIVTETNLIQRSFNDLKLSERAIVLSEHHSALKSQGKRKDLIEEIKILLEVDEQRDEATSGRIVDKLKSSDIVGQEYDMSGRNVIRYLRLNKLNRNLLDLVDDGTISFTAAIEVSYLNEDNQSYLENFLEIGEKLDIEKAKKLRELQKASKLDEVVMKKVLNGTYNPKTKKKKSILRGFKIESKVMKEYFNENQSEEEVKEIVKAALKMYFQSHQGG